MSFPRYPKYKDSGVEWLGQVPEHWEIAKTSRYFKIAMGQTILGEDLVDDGVWPVFSATEGNHYFGRINNPKVQLDVGDIVIPARGNSIGAVKLVKEPSSTTQTTIYCKHILPRKIDPYFVFYYLCGGKRNLFYFTQTAIPQITVEEVSSNPILIPPLPEQTAIAAFLDQETAKIDELVAEQKKLMELLKEKRQAVISHAVTKGIDPNAPMKPSGIEWLGDVPKHWFPKKIREISSLKGRLGWQGLKADEYRDQGPYVVSSAHFNDHEIQWEECPRVSQDRYDIDTNIQLTANDVLLMKDGAAMGKLAFVDSLPGSACLNSHLLLFRPLKANGVEVYFPRFVFYFMQTGYFQEYIKVNGTGATFLGISQEAIGRYQLVLPPYSEQTDIVAYLNAETAKFDALTAEAQRTIDLLQERRTALISAAVTGQIDVRQFAGKEST